MEIVHTLPLVEAVGILAQLIGGQFDLTATEFLGNYYTGQCEVADWTDIVAISTGGGRTMGLKADGTAVETVYTGYRLPSDDGLIGVNKWSDIKIPQQKVVS